MNDKKQTDPRLDTPSEANTEKHINFLEAGESQSGTRNDKEEKERDRQRKDEWQKGIEEGRNNSNNP